MKQAEAGQYSPAALHAIHREALAEHDRREHAMTEEERWAEVRGRTRAAAIDRAHRFAVAENEARERLTLRLRAIDCARVYDLEIGIAEGVILHDLARWNCTLAQADPAEHWDSFRDYVVPPQW